MLALNDWRIEESFSTFPQEASETLRWRDSVTSLSISTVCLANEQVFRLRMTPDFAVDVSVNGPIVVRKNIEVPQSTIDHFLADQVIPRLLSHSGSFVFHAGAVRLGGAALLLLGQSGRGKSTLVASFDQAGLALLGDDAMVLSMPGGIPHVKPVYTSLRLYPDSLNALMPEGAAAGPVAHYTDKQRIDVDVSSDLGAELPVQALFSIAAPGVGEQIRLRRLATAEACMLLIEGSFALDPSDLDKARRRLDDASALANRVPAFEISYPRDYARLPDVRQAILDQISALEAA